MNLTTLDDYEHVEEDSLRTQATMTQSQSLQKLLAVADEWRAVGCTPVFIVLQEEPRIIACVSEETFGITYQ